MTQAILESRAEAPSPPSLEEITDLLSKEKEILFVSSQGIRSSWANEWKAEEVSSVYQFRPRLGKDQGHAPFWIQAGEVFEHLLVILKGEHPPRVVVFLDPWAASFLSRLPYFPRQPKWVYVAGSGPEREPEICEYWGEMDRWVQSLPFTAVIPVSVFHEAVGQAIPQSPSSSSGKQLKERVFAKKHGAWEWHHWGKEEEASKTSPWDVAIVTRYSGNFLHTKVFLDSVLRQDFPLEKVMVAILSGKGRGELEEYLKWMMIAHPEAKILLLPEPDPSKLGWKEDFEEKLAAIPPSGITLLGDRTILPRTFLKSLGDAAREAKGKGILGLCLDPLSSSHVITGNLDPVEHYEKIAQAVGCQAPQDLPWEESGRYFPPALFNGTTAGIANRIMTLTGEKLDPKEILYQSLSPHPGEPLFLLELGNLP